MFIPRDKNSCLDIVGMEFLLYIMEICMMILGQIVFEEQVCPTCSFFLFNVLLRNAFV